MSTAVHVDTDLGGDPDDVAALGYLLASPQAEVVGVTTTDDPHGRRAAYVREVLRLAGRDDVPVAVGAAAALCRERPSGRIADAARYWPGVAETAVARGDPAAAVQLLDRAVGTGARLLAIGPWTNLALLERAAPGRLARADVVVMGGWAGPPPDGYPRWDAARDWNVACDVEAARTVIERAGRLTVVGLAVTALVHLRRADLPRLRRLGPLGELIAAQALEYAGDEDRATLADGHPGLPADLLNFHHDPLAAAVSLGWPGAGIARVALRPVVDDGVLRLERSPSGRPVDLVVDVDGPGFTEHWLSTLERLPPAGR